MHAYICRLLFSNTYVHTYIYTYTHAYIHMQVIGELREAMCRMLPLITVRMDDVKASMVQVWCPYFLCVCVCVICICMCIPDCMYGWCESFYSTGMASFLSVYVCAICVCVCITLPLITVRMDDVKASMVQVWRPYFICVCVCVCVMHMYVYWSLCVWMM